MLFEHIQAVDANEGRNFVLRFCRTIGPPMVECKLEEDWQAEILLPITKTVQMMSAVLDPVPKSLKSSSARRPTGQRLATSKRVSHLSAP